MNRHCLKAVALLLATAASPALAQDQPPATTARPARPHAATARPRPTAQRPVGIEQVTVTARRVRENLQHVPVSAAAFSSATLQAHLIATPQDLQVAVPGTFLGGSGSFVNSEYSIRGSAKPVAGAGAPGVVTYFDDVPLPQYVSSTPLYDIGSIQVLKGPQGTLFGRNTVGGAVLIYPEAPNFQGVQGYVETDVGNYATHDFEGAVNIPLIKDKLAIRIAGRIDRADGYVKNLGYGGNLENQYDNNGRVSLLYKPLDWLTNSTIYDFAEEPGSKAHGAAQIAIESGLPIPAVRALLQEQQARGPFVTDTGPLGTYDGWRAWGVTNRTDADLGRVQLTNIFGYRSVFDNDANNFDGLPGPFFDTFQEVETQQYSEELQARGHLFRDRLSWLVGGFYSDAPPAITGYSSDLAALGVPAGPVAYNDYGSKSEAAFLNLTYLVLPGVHLNGGFRYTWDQFSSCSGVGGPPGDGYSTPASDCLSLIDASRIKGVSSAPTWTLGGDWQVSKSLFLYVTSRRGYKTGGLNAPRLGVGLAPYQTFNPELTTDVEIGAKSNFRFGDVRTRFNIAAFHTRTTNDQLIGTQIATSTYQAAGLACVPPNYKPFIDGDCNPANDPVQTVMTINAGTVTTNGVEFDLTVVPFTGLVLNTGATLLDSETNQYNIPALLAAFFPTGGSIPLLFTPKETLTAGAAYTLPIPDRFGNVTLNAQYYRAGSVNFYGFYANPYDVVNARADWKGIFGSGFDFALFARNLFDRRYIRGPGLASNAAIPVNSALFGAPRQYGFELRYNFSQ